MPRCPWSSFYKFGNQYDSQLVIVQSVLIHKSVQSCLLTSAANLKPELNFLQQIPFLDLILKAFYCLPILQSKSYQQSMLFLFKAGKRFYKLTKVPSFPLFFCSFFHLVFFSLFCYSFCLVSLHLFLSNFISFHFPFFSSSQRVFAAFYRWTPVHVLVGPKCIYWLLYSLPLDHDGEVQTYWKKKQPRNLPFRQIGLSRQIYQYAFLIRT